MRSLIILCLLILFKKYNCSDSDDCIKKQRYPPTTVILLSTSDEIHQEKNSGFIYLLNQSGLNINLETSLIGDMPLTTVLDTFNTGRIVIHLYVKDFYQHNYNDILKRNFIYAGDIGPLREKTVCRSINADKNNTIETCDEINTKDQPYVKLVSESIYTNPILHNILTKYDGVTLDILDSCNIDTTNIVICEDNPELYNYMQKFQSDIKIKNVTSYECETAITKKTVSVITARPFSLYKLEAIDVPIIFYDQNYISSETKDAFINGFSMANTRDIMKFAFINFLVKMGRSRIGIISDDSPISQNFERDMILFCNYYHLVSGVKTCNYDGNCSEVFKSFVDADATVIIANIDEQNVVKFMKHMYRSPLKHRKITWLVRAWSPEVAGMAAKTMGDIFSISLGHMYDLFSIDLLNIIRRALFVTNLSFQNTIKKESYRKLAANIKHIIYQEIKITPVIKRYKNGRAPERINPNLPPPIESELSECIFKSKIYFKPCNDIEVILLIFIFLIFIVTASAIIYIFQSNDMPYERMTC